MRLLTDMKRGAIYMASVAGAAAVVMLAGCSGSSTDTSAAPAPSADATPHAAAVGAAVNSKLKLAQLALDSPIKETTDKNGLKFFSFKYTDNEGKVYQCMLPQAMGAGDHTASEWLGIFDVYKLPKVLAQKHVRKDSGQGLGDFPFIAPKPIEENKEEPKAEQTPKLPPMPTPPMPAPMPTSPAPGGGAPPSPGPSPAPMPR